MKKNMKKLLVIVMALMPSLSILSFAQEPGGGIDPNELPIKSVPGLGIPGPRVMANEPDDIPIIPEPGLGGGGPRIMSVGDPGDNDGGPIDLGLGGVRPRFMPDDYDDIPVVPHPNPNPNPGHEPRIRNNAQAPYCYHSAGVVYIEADSCITYINASVTRYADNQVWSNAASGNTLNITASPDFGEYYLELTLSSGQSYIGKYIIE